MAGKYFDELVLGMVVRHTVGRTITETDNVLFSALTMNTQPLHLNEDFVSKQTEFGRRIVNGIFTLGLAVGLSVADLTEGTIVANLGYEKVLHPNPVFHGDTLYVESTVIALRESRSNPQRGIATFSHLGRNQDGVVVIEFQRTVLMLKRPSHQRE